MRSYLCSSLAMRRASDVYIISSKWRAQSRRVTTSLPSPSCTQCWWSQLGDRLAVLDNTRTAARMAEPDVTLRIKRVFVCWSRLATPNCGYAEGKVWKPDTTIVAWFITPSQSHDESELNAQPNIVNMTALCNSAMARSGRQPNDPQSMSTTTFLIVGDMRCQTW
jgi:hypothetical protein